MSNITKGWKNMIDTFEFFPCTWCFLTKLHRISLKSIFVRLLCEYAENIQFISLDAKTKIFSFNIKLKISFGLLSVLT